MRPVIVSRSALDDIQQIRCFYDDQEAGAGDYFLACLREDVDSLQALHGIHRKKGHLHCMNASSFPHSIYYAEQETKTVVVAVLDQRRDPKWIRDQLRDR